jgi:hypothetical protein
MMPLEARSTVRDRASSDHEKPARGAKLFLSTRKSAESGLAAKARDSGTSNRSYRTPKSTLSRSLTRTSSWTNSERNVES